MMTRYFRLVFTALLVLMMFGVVSAQRATGDLRGFIYNKTSGEPLLYANVLLRGTTIGSMTDGNGYFIISNLQPGEYNVVITYIGFDTLVKPFAIRADEITTIKESLTERTQQLGRFTVSAERQSDLTETKTSIIKVTPKQIEKIPAIGGQADLAQYLQVLPGVVSTGDQGGKLYIRGGAPIQNKVLLDGMIIYNPFHTIGLFSVFDNDILKTADIYTGGFNADLGGRISSVMDIKTRDGNKKFASGGISGSTFGTKILLEGPIKAKEKEEGKASYILSFKNSFLEQSSKVLYEYVNDNGLPFNYTDVYGKVSLLADNGSKINFFGFNFSDHVNYQALSEFKWDTWGFGTNFMLIPAESPMLIEGNFAYSSYYTSLTDQSSLPKSSEIDGFNFGLHFSSAQGKNRNQYGLELLGFKTLFEITNAANRKINQTEYTTEMAFYWKYKLSIGNLIIEPGFRGHYYASLSDFSPEPRLTAKYKITDYFRVKAATGLYSQNLIAANSDRDVVNLFYGFLSGTENLQKTFDGKLVNSYLQKARHFILGAEIDLSRHAAINIEAYINQFTQLTSLNRNKIYDDRDPDYAEMPDYLKKDFIVERGASKGVDFSFRYELVNFNIWAVYSLGFITREEDLNGFLFAYTPHYDRRHNVNLVGAYSFGKTLQYEASLRWNYGSGFPFTPTAGFFEAISFQNGITTDYTTQNGDLGYFYGELNSRRLPDYHRLDATIKRSFIFTKRNYLDVVFSVTNVYSRNNIFYFDRIRYERVDQLPILPSLGINWRF
ncbi:MAG: TonB-dependent receptor [Bacteroidales bacterium]